MQDTDQTQGDKRYHLPEGEPLITPERAAKGDIFTGPDCGDCDATGKDPITKQPCRTCRGKGWVGTINAATIDSGHVRFAEVQQAHNLLNHLWDRTHITDQQHHDAETFQIWRDMHRAQLGTEKPVSSGGEEPLGVRLRAYGYVLIMQRLHRLDIAVVEAALLPMRMSWAEWLARNTVERFTAALERLSKLVPPIKDHITYLEGLAEDERMELSEDKLQILVARLIKAD